jgi:hypothetical protein
MYFYESAMWIIPCIEYFVIELAVFISDLAIIPVVVSVSSHECYDFFLFHSAF